VPVRQPVEPPMTGRASEGRNTWVVGVCRPVSFVAGSAGTILDEAQATLGKVQAAVDTSVPGDPILHRRCTSGSVWRFAFF